MRGAPISARAGASSDNNNVRAGCGAIPHRCRPDQAPARLFAYRKRELFAELIEVLVDASVEFLCGQVRAGADVVQIFDSWAGVLPSREFRKWSLEPVARIAKAVRSRHPKVKIIVFPRGAGSRAIGFTKVEEIDCLGLDTASDLEWFRAEVQEPG